MDLINDFSEEQWANKGSPPPDPPKGRYRRYSVFQRYIKNEDSMTYYMKTDDGKTLEAKLTGVLDNHNPLKGVQNCYLKLDNKDKDGKDCVISGIITDYDWVELKS